MFDPLELAARLIRIDTTNPPGNEAAAIEVIRETVESAGVHTTLLARDPSRPNLVARIPGTGVAPGILMQGHVDVVPVTGQRWSRDPFSGEVVDGYLWGRGAIDMKGGVAMMTNAFCRLASGPAPPGDVVLCVVSDEEAGGVDGARFLVEEHAELFAGIGYSIGEFGGFPLQMAGRRFYPIQIAERIGVRFELTFRGPGGHGSLPAPGGPMARLGRVLTRLDRRRLPVHVVPATRMMLQAMIDHTDGATSRILRTLLDPRSAGAALKLAGSKLGVLEPVLRNTVSPTIVSGGDKYNVIPSEITLTLDGRMLPGLEPEQMAAELADLVGEKCEISFETEGIPGGGEPDLGLFPLLADLLTEMDPEAVPIPFLLPAVTDGRWFSQLGIQHYGFLPMRLADDFVFQDTVHGADERIPVDALRQGADAIHGFLKRYPGGGERDRS